MEKVIQTPYGEVGAGRLEELQSSFDTRRLLQAVEVIDRFCGQWKSELRDDLLAIHSMAHTAYSVGEEFRRESLGAAVALLDQIAIWSQIRRAFCRTGLKSQTVRPTEKQRVVPRFRACHSPCGFYVESTR
jgi:hypothetical protein